MLTYLIVAKKDYHARQRALARDWDAQLCDG
jgi:hypothetical protein